MIAFGLFLFYTSAMNRTAVEEIKARIPIEDLIGQYVKLEKAGKSFKARCPFHNEKSASFFVSPERGGYYCFGCNAKGDIFTFVEQFEGLDFRGALKILAERAGVQLTYDQKADGEKDRLFQIMEDATKYFEAMYEKSKEAQEYVKSRGISDETRKHFRIGWAPEGWQNLLDYLRAKKYPDALIEKAGLIKASQKDTDMDKDRGTQIPSSVSLSSSLRYYDRFRGRIMFPIGDSSGRIIAFSGRILPKLDDGKAAKYLNSPDTPLYDKSLVLYGLDKAKGEIRRLNYSIMVEGQMDLVMSHQAGIKNTVASSGTALTDEAFNENGAISNLGLVRRLSPNVIVAFDSDAAGRKAALRAAGIGLSLGMDVKIADIVGGKDPADLVKEDVNKWRDALKNAKPIVEFELGNVLHDNPDARKVPRALKDRVFPFLARMGSEMDKSHFVKMIADKAHITEDAVWLDLRATERTLREASPGTDQAEAFGGRRGREAGAGLASPDAGSARAVRGDAKHIDLVERRLFGLLSLMETAKSAQAENYRNEIRKISGDSYDERVKRVEPVMNDVTFEAEAFFGGDEAHWDRHMKELLVNFEEDVVNEQLLKAMRDLRVAEKEGRQDDMNELAKKCQVLSIRKAEVGKRRRIQA